MTGTFVVPSATEVYYNTEARRQSNGYAYRGRVRITATHRLRAEVVRFTGSGTGDVLTSVLLSTTVSSGQSVTVKLSVAGTSPVVVSSKAYLTGSAEPDWQAKYTDNASTRISAAGAVGAGGEVSVSNSSAVSLVTSSISALSDATAAAAPGAGEPADTGSSTSSGTGSAAVGTTFLRSSQRSRVRLAGR